MSREEKEKLLTEKMENIRKRNEELRKRHEEIEADKKNADKFSSTVTMDKVKPYVMKVPRSRPEKPERSRESTDHQPIPRPSDVMPSRQRLSENDGPPPDPSYRFLSDPDRDGNERERKKEGRMSKRKGKQGFKGEGCEGQEDEDRNKLDWEGDKLETECCSMGRGNVGNSRGKTKFEVINGEQKHGWGRGREKGYDRSVHQEDDDVCEVSHSEGSDGRKKGRGRSSFACRDIRYYPNEDEYQRVGKDGTRGRGRQHYNKWNYSDESQYKGQHRQGSYEQRGRGRGRGRDKQREYERWKAERAAIDEARLMRGKTDGGSWRREWDNDKMSQGEVDDESEPVYDPRFPRSKTESFKLADLITLADKDGCDQQCVKQQEEVSKEQRSGTGRGSREKFVKVDREQVNKQLALAVDDNAVFEVKVHQTTSAAISEENSEEDKLFHVRTADEEDKDIAAENISSVIDDDNADVKNMHHDYRDSSKEATEEEIIDKCCNENDKKIEGEIETNGQLAASDLVTINDKLAANSLTMTDGELAADSLMVTSDELAGVSFTITSDELDAASLDVTDGQITMTDGELPAGSVIIAGDELVDGSGTIAGEVLASDD